MRVVRTIAIMIALLLTGHVAAPCWGHTVKYAFETFEGTLEEASWRSGPADEIVADGGNPGAFLHVASVVTDATSIAASGPPWIWTGTYRNMGVIELGVDVELFGNNSKALDSPASFELIGDGMTAENATNDARSEDRPVSLELINNNFTPDDPTDDCIVVQVGKKLPKAGGGWGSYNFHVPSYMTSLPSGWTVRAACGGLSPDAVWNKVMEFVVEARFVLGDPDVQYPVEVWDVGFDNPRIRLGKNRGTGPSLTEIDSPWPSFGGE